MFLIFSTTTLNNYIIYRYNKLHIYLNRTTGGSLPKEGQNHETALLCWLSHVCAALKRRIDKEIENGATDENVNIFCITIVLR